MQKMIMIWLAALCLTAAPLWATENQPMHTQNSYHSGSEYRTDGMGPGMMGPGSGYHGHGPGMMMGNDSHMDRRMGGYGHRMAPGQQGWQSMPPEQREQWRQMRADFMQETLSLRQELNAKQMEIETLWDQKNPDLEKINTLSDRIATLRATLDQKHDAYLTQCRQRFGDRGWACPGSGRQGY